MAKRRDHILESAEQEFLSKGYDGTSIDAIVKEAGGSKSTVYFHFRDKSGLFAAALEDIRSGFDFSLQASRKEPSATTADRLTLMGVELLSILFHERLVHLVRTVIAESKRFPEVARQFVRDGIDLSRRSIAQEIEAARERAEVTVDDAAIAAEKFVSLLLGTVHLELLLGTRGVPDAREIAQIAREATKSFLKIASGRHL